MIQHSGWGAHLGADQQRQAAQNMEGRKGELEVVAGARRGKSRWSEEKAIEDFLASKSDKIAKKYPSLDCAQGSNNQPRQNLWETGSAKGLSVWGHGT